MKNAQNDVWGVDANDGNQQESEQKDNEGQDDNNKNEGGETLQKSDSLSDVNILTNKSQIKSATEWILTSHHFARVIAGIAQQRREQALAPSMFRGLLGPDVSVSDVLRKKSKEKLKDQAKTTKLIEHPKEISATNLKPVMQQAEVSQSNPSTSSVQQQVRQLIQILPLPWSFTFQSQNLPNQQQQQGSITAFVVGAVAEEAHINVTVLEIYNNTIIVTSINQANSKIIRTNFCRNLLHSYRTRRHHRTNSPLYNNRNRNESGHSKTLRLTKKYRKLKILRARMRRPNDQLIIIQEKALKEVIMLQYSIDLGKTSVLDRLMARLDQQDKLDGTQTMIRGAQPD
ncbi:MAG: hypothetical protein EZS28_006398 [Streblomastix strix]|uniref:Uncharacterized protein n=1 Tax=Streblomastix strix TaxID=222440 RepID=A0A5J4WT08_9EUKA|nr:MAG: hypothetical protein EZS28_006398 [Streblomastix strix]